VPAVLAWTLAGHVLPRPHRDAFGLVPELAPQVLAAIGLFAIAGFGPVRFLLPARLRPREALWVLPVGACTSSLAMTVLGFLALPFTVSLGVVIAGGALLAVVALRRGGVRPRSSIEVAWPAWVALLTVGVALLPIFLQDYASVTGDGSDAHLAAGTAVFLQHSYPTSTDVSLPVDKMPLIWRSKYPIYYALGGVATLAGKPPHLVLTPLLAVLLALAATGFFLVGRDTLGAGVGAALAGMGLIALDRMVLHTGLHPYYNQTWGFFTMAFALVLAWEVVRAPARDGPGERSWGAWVLLALFLAVGALAYPLALPFPLGALAVAWVLERRRRRAEGEPLRRLRDLRGRRSILWALPLLALLAVPLFGVVEKFTSAARVVLPGRSLDAWGGDVTSFFPSYYFFGIGSPNGATTVVVAIGALAIVGLRRQPRPLAWGLIAVIAFGLLGAAYFSQREFGYYFHFKLLAFAAPLVLVCAVAGAARLRWLGAVAVAILLSSAHLGAREEMDLTGHQLGKPVMQLAEWGRRLPPGASVRLDVNPGKQLWIAYFLSGQPLCSQRPLFATNYPRVPISRRADFVLIDKDRPEPLDAVGRPVMVNDAFRLWRLRPGLPGRNDCSRRMIDEGARSTAL